MEANASTTRGGRIVVPINGREEVSGPNPALHPTIGEPKAPRPAAIAFLPPHLQSGVPLDFKGSKKRTTVAGIRPQNLRESDVPVPFGPEFGVFFDGQIRERAREDAEYASTPNALKGFVDSNVCRSNCRRQYCTEIRRHRCTEDRRRNCTECRTRNYGNFSKQVCTGFGKPNCTEACHRVPPGFYRPGGDRPQGDQLSASFPAWSDVQGRTSVVEETSWLKVGVPYQNGRRSFKEVAGAGYERDVEFTTLREQVVLDEETWPSLRESCVRGQACVQNGLLGHLDEDGEVNCQQDGEYCKVAGIGERKNWQPLTSILQKKSNNVETTAPLNKATKGKKGHEDREPQRNVEGMPAVLLMLNKDFIVTSPLKQNLLLTLALTERNQNHHEALEAVDDGKCGNVRSREPSDQRRQILVGQFIAFSSFLHFVLGRDATRVRTECNAGGTSTISESLSVEYFVRRFQAKDIVTEMEVEYCALNWKKVDYICTLYGQRVGISVTRAMSFPDPKDFSPQMAYRLLYKKLFGLVVARHGVSKRHSFSQCILHVWCETQGTAHILQQEYEGVSQELDITDDVIMVLTVAEGWHARPIFYESILKTITP